MESRDRRYSRYVSSRGNTRDLETLVLARWEILVLIVAFVAGGRRCYFFYVSRAGKKQRSRVISRLAFFDNPPEQQYHFPLRRCIHHQESVKHHG